MPSVTSQRCASFKKVRCPDYLRRRGRNTDHRICDYEGLGMLVQEHDLNIGTHTSRRTTCIRQHICQRKELHFKFVCAPDVKKSDVMKL